MKYLLSNQNTKLGRLSSFSLPLSSCDKNHCQLCKKYCYAKYMNRIYPAYRAKMTYNFKATKKYDFVARMNKELDEASLYIRVHVSGDFYNQLYLNEWFLIAKMNPNRIFYCYTKAIDMDFGNRPSNFIVYISDDQRVLSKHYSRFDGVATISFDKKPIEGYVLCPHQKDKKMTCAHCRLCMKPGNKIYFNLH